MNAFETGLLRYLTPEQLKQIQDTTVAIAGAGGLGSNAAMALVRTGFRQLEILDKDVIEASNLNRQDYTLADIGQPKVECLKQRMLSINPDAAIVFHQKEWTPANARDFFQTADILVEAFDTAGIKSQFVEYYASQKDRPRPVVSGNGMAGVNVGTSASALRRIGNIYIVGDGETSIHDGHPPLAPRVLQCAAKMAEVVLLLTISGGRDETASSH